MKTGTMTIAGCVFLMSVAFGLQPAAGEEARARFAASGDRTQDVMEERDVAELLREGKIEMQAGGSGIQTVSVRIRRLVPYPIVVLVPVGTYFVSGDRETQSMVTTMVQRIQLTTDDWYSLSPSAACANLHRNVPSGGDAFRIERSPHQDELARLMPLLNRAGVDYATRQAAVWIVTDNAGYDELGILVVGGGFGGFGGSRIIRETEAARAMKICEEAGIDITRKAIWKDRTQICAGLKDDNLRRWLEQKE